MNKKLFLTACFLFGMVISIIYSLPVYAETQEVTFVLHKLLLGDKITEGDSIIQNNGSISPDGLELLKNQTGLNGVEFTFYDITDDFYLLRNEGQTIEEAQRTLSIAPPLSKPVMIGNTGTVGAEEGILSVNLPSKYRERDAVYLIKETNTPEGVKNLSIPVVVVLPVMFDNTKSDTIHLFVKNERDILDQPTLEKTIMQETHDVSYGDKVSYTINTEIPQDILKYDSYTLEDEADPSLWLIKEDDESKTLRVFIDGEFVTDCYQIKQIRDHGFTLIFNPKILGDYPQKNISITYDVEFRGDTSLDQTEFTNQVILIPGNEPRIKTEETVYTGGYHFMKLNLDQHEQVLSGAEFIVKNNQGYFLSEMSKGKYQWVKNKKNAMHLISDDRGSFMILGLEYGDYMLEEVKAPSGYILNETAISFTVTKESYQETRVYPLKIWNRLASKPPSKPFPGNHLPQTNDTYKPLVSIIGVCFIGLIIIVKKRRKDDGKSE